MGVEALLAPTRMQTPELARHMPPNLPRLQVRRPGPYTPSTVPGRLPDSTPDVIPPQHMLSGRQRRHFETSGDTVDLLPEPGLQWHQGHPGHAAFAQRRDLLRINPDFQELLEMHRQAPPARVQTAQLHWLNALQERTAASDHLQALNATAASYDQLQQAEWDAAALAFADYATARDTYVAAFSRLAARVHEGCLLEDEQSSLLERIRRLHAEEGHSQRIVKQLDARLESQIMMRFTRAAERRGDSPSPAVGPRTTAPQPMVLTPHLVHRT